MGHIIYVPDIIQKAVLLLIFWPCAFPIFGPRTAGRLDGSPLHVDGAMGGAHRRQELGVLDALVVQVLEPLKTWDFPRKSMGKSPEIIGSTGKTWWFNMV